jgi:hypothetical protein
MTGYGGGRSQADPATGWNEKGHKADCKLLKDADLNGLFSLKWDNFEGHVGFPLNTAAVQKRLG